MISPVQALTFRFRFTSPPQGNLLRDIELGSLTVNDRVAYLNVGDRQDDYNSNSQINLGNFTNSLSNPIAANRTQNYYSFVSTDAWKFDNYYLPLPIFWNVIIFCDSQLINCSGARGGFLASSIVPIAGNLYNGSGDIIIDSISLSQPPNSSSNSLPEPSLVSALLLLGGCFTREKLKKFKSQIG